MHRSLKRLLLGRPLHNEDLVREKLPKWKALSIFSSDSLSSIGYGPEQIVLFLSAGWAIAYGYTWMVALAILALLGIVAVSYSQISQANPEGGGSYNVAKKNLNETAALVTAAALFIDYSLTVAVSISSGTDAIVSAFPFLAGHRIGLNLLVLFGILMLVNLRGVRESSNAFVFPTYAFITGIFLMIAAGVYQGLTPAGPAIPEASFARQPLDLTVMYLILRAFASGCSSMTGIEAISDGVPVFEEPSGRNAKVTTLVNAFVLATMFAGITYLFLYRHVMPAGNVTMLSQVAEQTFGRSVMYYYIQITTMLILYLAANTAYNGLPPLLSILARDGYMPRYLAARGDRLTFHNGIILLSVVAAALLIIYGGNTEHLISLYALGVFLSFTIAQTGMVLHWRRKKDPGWVLRAFLNGLGAAVTGLVVVVIMIAKFTFGAWAIPLVILLLVWMFRKIHNHYEDMRAQLGLPPSTKAGDGVVAGKNIVIVPIAGVTRVVENTLAYARKISEHIIAVNVATDVESARKVRKKWEAWDTSIKLVVLYSPHRTIMNPLFRFIGKVEKKIAPGDYITVLIPEFETRKWWHRLLHNQTGWLLRTLLLLNKNVIVTVVPYRLQK